MVLPILEKKTENQTLQRIKMNALQQFSQYGYEGVSIRDITRASEVTKPTLYYYFKNKEDLYRILASTSVEELLTILKQSITGEASTQSKVLSFLHAYSKLCSDHYYLVRFILTQAFNPSRQIPDIDSMSFSRNVTEMIEGIINEGVIRGEVSFDKSRFISCAIHSIIQTRITSLLTLNDKTSSEAVVEGTISLILER